MKKKVIMIFFELVCFETNGLISHKIFESMFRNDVLPLMITKAFLFALKNQLHEYEKKDIFYYFFQYAAMYNHMDILLWLKNDFSFYDSELLKNDFHQELIIENVIKNGNIEILKWLIGTEKFHFDFKADDASIIALTNQIKIAKYMLQQSYRWRSTNDRILRMFKESVKYGNLELMEYLWTSHKNVIEKHLNLLTQNMYFNTLSKTILEWLLDHGFKTSTSHFAACAQYCDLETVIWFEQYCSFDSSAYFYAARNSKLDILFWLRENNCPFDSQLELSYGSNMNIIKWFHETFNYINGSPLYHSDLLNDFESLQWFYDNSTIKMKKTFITISFLRNVMNLTKNEIIISYVFDFVIKYLTENNMSFNREIYDFLGNYNCFKQMKQIYLLGIKFDILPHLSACDNGSLEVIQWFYIFGYKYQKNDSTLDFDPLSHNYLDIVEWFNSTICCKQ